VLRAKCNLSFCAQYIDAMQHTLHLEVEGGYCVKCASGMRSPTAAKNSPVHSHSSLCILPRPCSILRFRAKLYKGWRHRQLRQHGHRMLGMLPSPPKRCERRGSTRVRGLGPGVGLMFGASRLRAPGLRVHTAPQRRRSSVGGWKKKRGAWGCDVDGG
jgi:hypothetical protein